MIIPVVHCCGVFGFHIPWAEWMCRPFPLYAHAGGTEKHVYIYSIKGQLGDPRREMMVTPPPNCIHCPPRLNNPNTVACINIDRYILWHSLALDVNNLASAITSAYVKATEPPPAPPTEPEPATPVEAKKTTKRKKK